MCGLVGVINHKANGLMKADEDIFKRLLYIDKERGEDSTGVFTVLNSGVCMIAKEASTPEQFNLSKEADDIYRKAWNTGALLVGHNRKATSGKVTDENAHPFHVGDIVLVHNGSLNNHKDLADTGVDSEAIAVALNEYRGTDITEVFNRVNGAYSCIWYDNRTDTLNFFRNIQRPMWIYEDHSSTYFASDCMMLYYSLHKSAVKWEKEKCMELPVHTHLQYKLKNHGGMEKLGLTKLEIKPSFTTGVVTLPATTVGHAPTATIKPAVPSLSERKRMRNQMQTFLKKYPTDGKTVCNFIADDWISAGDTWLLVGLLEGSPPFITTTVSVPGAWSEEEMVDMLDKGSMQLPVRLMSQSCEHKKLSFQINAEVLSETAVSAN